MKSHSVMECYKADARIAELEARLKEAEGDIEELTFCEDCGEDDTKLKENNCWPPRYCHSCRHKLVTEICELRKQAKAYRNDSVNVIDKLEAAEARAEAAEKRSATLTVQLSEEYRDWMKEQCNEECRYGERLYADKYDEAKRLRAALEQVEWMPTYDGWTSCPWCDRFQDGGHKPDCARQAALSPEREEEGKR